MSGALQLTLGARLRMVGCSAVSAVKMPGVKDVSAAAMRPAPVPIARPAANTTLHVCPSSQSPAGSTRVLLSAFRGLWQTPCLAFS